MKSSSEIELSFHGLTEKDDVIDRVLQLAFLPLEKANGLSRLSPIREQLKVQLQEDPYLQGKLDRLLGLLEKHV